MANSGLGGRFNAGGTSDAVLDGTVIVSVVVGLLEFGVTEEGLKLQLARFGSPAHEKLIVLVNEPCGVTVKMTDPGLLADTVTLAELGVNVKSGACTV